jgi:hypothetical protein
VLARSPSPERSSAPAPSLSVSPRRRACARPRYSVLSHASLGPSSLCRSRWSPPLSPFSRVPPARSFDPLAEASPQHLAPGQAGPGHVTPLLSFSDTRGAVCTSLFPRRSPAGLQWASISTRRTHARRRGAQPPGSAYLSGQDGSTRPSSPSFLASARLLVGRSMGRGKRSAEGGGVGWVAEVASSNRYGAELSQTKLSCMQPLANMCEGGRKTCTRKPGVHVAAGRGAAGSSRCWRPC